MVTAVGRERDGRRLLAAQDSDRGRVRIVNAAAVTHHLGSSVLPSMSVNVICSSLNPDTSIALIVNSMPSFAAAFSRLQQRRQWCRASPILPMLYLPLAVRFDGRPHPTSRAIRILPDLDNGSRRLPRARPRAGRPPGRHHRPRPVSVSADAPRFPWISRAILCRRRRHPRLLSWSACSPGQLDAGRAELELRHRIVVFDRHRELPRADANTVFAAFCITG